VNRWYSISEEQLTKCKIVKNQFGKEVVDVSTSEDLQLIAELHNLSFPIVFNSSIPHSVEKTRENTNIPRIVASFTFHNEPLSWLK
jgi:hypothetical protein